MESNCINNFSDNYEYDLKYNENDVNELSGLERSVLLLQKLDTFNYSKRKCSSLEENEEIGMCCKCNKLIALKFTTCKGCNKHYCIKHREGHECSENTSKLKVKLNEGKNAFLDKLKQAKIKAGVK